MDFPIKMVIFHRYVYVKLPEGTINFCEASKLNNPTACHEVYTLKRDILIGALGSETLTYLLDCAQT